jgi:hypothetical protein
MALIVIGGHTRSVGKTSVVAGLIAALRDHHWTALKITQYGHGVCSANGEACDCATADHSFAITEERDRSGETDTSRFLVAGAVHSWWVRTQQGHLAEAMPRVRNILAGAANAIIESNSILRFIKPDVYITVLDPATADFKSSAQQFLDRADAVLLHSTGSPTDPPNHAAASAPAWKQISLRPVANRPMFAIRPPSYVTPELTEFVRARLSAGTQSNGPH